MEKYNLDLNGSTNKPMPQMDNYHRDDSGLGPNAQNMGVTQQNDRQDVNGSSDKPYPTERNFTMDVAATQPSGMGVFVPQMNPLNVKNRFGQAKYARREGAVSIYKDSTRNTENDNLGSAKAEGSSICEPEGENKRDD